MGFEDFDMMINGSVGKVVEAAREFVDVGCLQ